MMMRNAKHAFEPPIFALGGHRVILQTKSFCNLIQAGPRA